MKVYIAGPMAGLPGKNRPAFFTAERMWQDAGHEVGNPAHIPDYEYKVCLKKALAIMLECDAVAMLPGWRESNGANNLERYVANFLDMPIYDARHPKQLVEIEAGE
jgi:hypothetical protein